MQPIVALFSLLVAAAGWFYMFYSRAAHRLGAVEDPRANTVRRRLRQVNGGIMFLMGVLFFAGFNAVDPQIAPNTFVGIWFGVFVLLMLIVLLALVDVRLTWKMGKPNRRP